ncbi:MAG: GNAT family N-acetyltransferase [Candidatus Obscuribacter sp.]|nr:GNAT family N-acetyltransferase [Candidatus Obscuribacter sp.]
MLQSKLLIRPGTLAERPQVAAVTRQAYADYASTSDPEFWQQYQDSTEQTLLYDDAVLRLVALGGDEIVGTVLLCPPYQMSMGDTVVTNPYPEMRLLAVLPGHRDSGIGAQIINDCERRTRDDGYSAITLHTTVLMQTAKAMYERRGYVRYPEIDFEPVPGFVVWGYIKQF